MKLINHIATAQARRKIMIRMISMIAYEDPNGLDYYMVSNSQHKAWLIPSGKISLIEASFALYSPASAKGKLIKKLFAYIPRFVKKKIARPIKLKFDDDWLKKLLKKEILRYSIFLGTPSAHQKPVMQIMDGDNRILAYMKLSDNEDVIKIIGNEAKMIEYLQQNNVDNIPQILSLGTRDNYRYLIVDTKRTLKSKCDLRWNSLYEKCLDEIYNKTAQTNKLEESDVYKYIAGNLPEIRSFFSENEYDAVCKAFEKIDKSSEMSLSLAFYHRDFKPWNCYMSEGKLQVYDFEYSMTSAPIGLDRIHFISQVEHLTNKKTSKKIVMSIIESTETDDSESKLTAKELIILYALDMMTLYTTRSKGIDGETRFYYNILLEAVDGDENG